MSSRHAADLEDEIVGLHEAIDKRDSRIRHLEAAARQARAEKEDLAKEKSRLKEELSKQRSQLELQERRLADAERATEDVRRLQKDGCGEQYRLEVENQTLRSAIEVLQENEDDLVEEVETISKERSALERNFRSACLKNDRLQSDIDAISKKAASFQEEKNNLEQKLESEIQKAQEAKAEREKEKCFHNAEIEKLLQDLESERQKNTIATEKAALSHGANVQKCLEKHVGDLQTELQRVVSELAVCNEDKAGLEQDLQSACHALENLKNERDDQIAAAVRTERDKLEQAEAKTEATESKVREYHTRSEDLEEQAKRLGETLRRAEERNSWYEKGHGLSSAVRYQKKLEADIDRRDRDIKKLSVQLGETAERCQILTKALDILKEKANVPADFDFNDEEIKDALRQDDNSLRSQNAELSRQIDVLEVERLQLMKQLRHNAAQIGENGIRFLGLTAEQILKVTEFASNLRDGSIELPMNDRSMELMAQLAELRAESERDKVTIERLEHEIVGLGGKDIEQNQTSMELAVVRQVLEEIRGQNKVLKQELFALKEKNSEELSQNFDDEIPPLVRERIEEVIGEAPVGMPSKAQVQLICLLREYDKTVQELTVVRASLKRWKTEQQQNVERAPKRVDEGQQFMPCIGDLTTSAGRNLLKKKLSNLGETHDSALREYVEGIVRQLVKCLEELGAVEREKLEYYELLQRYECNISSIQKNATKLFRRHIDFVRESSLANKKMTAELESISAERDGLLAELQGRKEADILTRKKSGELDNGGQNLGLDSAGHTIASEKLSRKCERLHKQLSDELDAREKIEREVVEIEAFFRRRIVVLEEWKASAIDELSWLQKALEKSVPAQLYHKVVRELESSREECLIALHRSSDMQLCLLQDKGVVCNESWDERFRETKKRCSELEDMYDCGLTKTEAESLRKEYDDAMKQIEYLKREAKRQKQLSAIASAQVDALQAFKRNYAEEITCLQDFCSDRDGVSDESFTVEKLRREIVLSKRLISDLQRKNDRLKSHLIDRDTKLHSVESTMNICTEELNRTRELYRIQMVSVQHTLYSWPKRSANHGTVEFVLGTNLEKDIQYAAAACGAPTASSHLLFLAKNVAAEVSVMASLAVSSEKIVPDLKADIRALIEEKRVLVDALKILDTNSDIPPAENEYFKKILDELQLSKIAAVKYSRESDQLKEENATLKNDIAKYQDMLREAEEARLQAEVGGFCGDKDDNLFLARLLAKTDIADGYQQTKQMKGASNIVTTLSEGHGDRHEGTLLMHEPEKCSVIDSEHSLVVEKLLSALEDLSLTRKELERSRQELLKQKLQCATLQENTDSYLKQMLEDSSKELLIVKEAADKTISNLKKLLDEKNIVIDDCKRKIKEFSRNGCKLFSRHESSPTALDESSYTIEKLREAAEKVSFSDSPGAKQNLNVEVARRMELVRQVDEAQALMCEKDVVIKQLKEKLQKVEESNQHSEERCTQAIQEVGRMQVGMSHLAGKVAYAEERALVAVQNRAAEEEISKLQCQLREKEKELGRLVLSVDKLRQENRKNQHSCPSEKVVRGSKSDGADECNSEKMEKLMADVSKAKAALLKTRLSKEKAVAQLHQSRKEANEAFDDIRRLETEVDRLKKNVAEANKDKENMELKAHCALEKLKELKAKAPEAQIDDNLEKAKRLEQRVEELQRQNVALRSSLASSKFKTEAKRSETRPQQTKRKIYDASVASIAMHAKVKLLEKELKKKEDKIRELEEATIKKKSREESSKTKTCCFQYNFHEGSCTDELGRVGFGLEKGRKQAQLDTPRDDNPRANALEKLPEKMEGSGLSQGFSPLNHELDHGKSPKSFVRAEEFNIFDSQHLLEEYRSNKRRPSTRLDEPNCKVSALLTHCAQGKAESRKTLEYANIKFLDLTCRHLQNEDENRKRCSQTKISGCNFQVRDCVNSLTLEYNIFSPVCICSYFTKSMRHDEPMESTDNGLQFKADEMKVRIRALEAEILKLKRPICSQREVGTYTDSGNGSDDRQEIDSLHHKHVFSRGLAENPKEESVKLDSPNEVVVDIRKYEDMAKLKADLSKVMRENELLHDELRAFDMNFFEEIEDLKKNYIIMKQKYEEAVCRLNKYEAS